MSNYFHTPLTLPQQITVASVNGIAGTLDQAIKDIHFTYSGNPVEYLDGSGAFSIPSGTGPGINGHVITDEGGADLPQRAKMDFIGDLVVASNGASATEVLIELTNDTSPVFGGNPDLAGNYLFDSVGNVEINDALDVTGTVTVTTGDVVLDNIKEYQIEDSGGTARSMVKLTGSNIVHLGSQDVSWGANTFIYAGTTMRHYVNGNSGAHTLAAEIATSGDFQLQEDLQLENNKAVKFKDSGGAAKDVLLTSVADAIVVGHAALSWGTALALRAGTAATIDVNRASGTATEATRWDTDGNQLLGTITSPTGTHGKTLMFGDNGGDPTPGSNTAGIYGKDVAGTVEVFAVDEAGNTTQLTSHDAELIEQLSDPDEYMPYVYKSSNHYIGKQVAVDFIKMARLLEEQTGETLVHYSDVEKRDWDADQQASVDQRNAQIAEWNERKVKHDELLVEYALKLDAYNKELDARKKMKKSEIEKLPELIAPQEPTDMDECPKPITKKKMPKWIADRKAREEQDAGK